MYTRKTKHTSNRFDSDTPVRKKKNDTSHFEDTRPEALQLKKIQEIMVSNTHPVQFQSNSNAPIQRMPDWLAKLLSQVGENKLESFALAATAGFAGVLLYYYFKGKPSTKTRIEKASKEEEPPDFSTLESLAKTIGVDPEELEWQLEDAPEINPHIPLEEKRKLVTVNALYRKGFDPETMAATGVVPPSLLEDLPESELDKLEELFYRFNNLAFNYTGSQANGASGFLSRQGDCSTLALMFKLAAEAAGIKDVEIETDPVPMLVPAAPIHGRGSQRNVDGISCWAFVDHHWCTYQGQKYDLLFMNAGPDEVVHRDTAHIYNGITYYLFEDGRAIIYEEMYTNLTATLSKGSEGRVFRSDDDAENYINTYKK
jgi:transcriptional regulator with XRE-family HTH domain